MNFGGDTLLGITQDVIFKTFFSTLLFSSTKWSESFSCKVYRNTENGEMFFFCSCSGFSGMNIAKKKT